MDDGRRATARALRLSLPDAPPVDASAADWAATHAIARRERLCALAWERNARVIAAGAPAAVASAWRADAIAAVGRAERQRAVLGSVLEVLRAAIGDRADRVVVLRGLALAQRLYGAPAVRWTGDTDLYVPTVDRDAAHEALVADGWLHRYGTRDSEALYMRESGGAWALLEVHSSLADDQLLVHLRPPAPRAATTDVDGLALPAHDDAYLPAYLATHLAKHGSAPLLWDVDVHTLWSALDAAARAAALEAARVARTSRYLRWALARAAAIPAAAEGDASALGRLGVEPDGRIRTRHNALHVARLADGVVDAARVARQWAWSNGQGRGWEVLRFRVRRILGRPLTTATAAATLASVPETVERRAALEIAGSDLAETVRAIVGAGGAMWIRARGGSMQPAIPHASLVRLVPVNASTLARGHVVLAVVGGRLVMHRVVARAGDRYVLQGDTMARSDGVIGIADVLAVVDALSLDERVIPMATRRGPRWWRALRRLPRQGAVLASAGFASRGSR